mgnify:CR=1 FL=1
MKWTTDKPTEPGWYFVDNPPLFPRPSVVEIMFETHNRLDGVINKTKFWNAKRSKWEDVDGAFRRWAGPIQEPEDD